MTDLRKMRNHDEVTEWRANDTGEVHLITWHYRRGQQLTFTIGPVIRVNND